MAQPGQGGRQPSSWPIGRRDGCETPSVDRARHERRSPRFSCVKFGWVLDGTHSHPAVGDPQKQAVLAAWDPRLCLQAKETGSDTDMNGAGERWSSASRMVMGRWLLGTLHGYREGVVKKKRYFRPLLPMDLFSKGVYGHCPGRDRQSNDAGPFRGLSASISMPTRPRESSAPRAARGNTPAGGVWRTTGSLPHEGTRTDTGVKGTLPSAPRGTTQATKFGVNQVYIKGYLCARFDAGSSCGSCASMDGPPVGTIRDPRKDLGSRGNSPFFVNKQ